MSVPVFELKRYQKSYQRLAPHKRRQVDKQRDLLEANIPHKSLKPHRAKESKIADMWIVYVNINDRLLFLRKNGAIYLWDVGTHDVEKHL